MGYVNSETLDLVHMAHLQMVGFSHLNMVIFHSKELQYQRVIWTSLWRLSMVDLWNLVGYD